MQIDNAIINTINRYRKAIENDEFLVDSIIVYGSYANGTYKKDSDIDVCVISNSINENNYFEKKSYLWSKTRGIDTRIEPVAFSVNEFGQSNPLIEEIKKNGVIISNYGKDLAKITSMKKTNKILNVVEAIKEFRKGKKLGGVRLKSLIKEGRK